MVTQQEINSLKKQLESDKAEKEFLTSKFLELSKRKEEIQEQLESHEKARIIIQEVARGIHESMKSRISSLVSAALMGINEKWPKFKMAIETRRNQPEVDFFFVENGIEQEPLESSGGGVTDIAADALSLSVWSLNKNRPTLIKDEPFRNLSKNNSIAASKMLKMLCDKLKIQIIIVSHDTEITKFADKVFVVKKQNGVSTCMEMKNE